MIVDLIIVAAVVLFAVGGYVHGLISSLASFLGFVVGLIVGIRLAVWIGRDIDNSTVRVAVVLLTVIVLGGFGQFIFSYLATRLKKHITWQPGRTIDRVFGGVISAVAAVLVCWMLAVPLASSPIPGVAKAIKESTFVKLIDDSVPPGVRKVYTALQEILANQGLPDVVDPLNSTTAQNVGPPQEGLAGTAPIVAARNSIVKVRGEADACSRLIDGSGFVFAKDRIMTNAHVLAGTSSVQIESAYGIYDAIPVYVDEQTDVAVLEVSNFPGKALKWAPEPADSGADVVVAGHPGGGDYQAQAARVRGVGSVTGPNFRRDGTVVRDVYALRAHVIPGNSGGPLLAPNGSVLGVIFASAADNADVGYALTRAQVTKAVSIGTSGTELVSTGSCD